MTGVRAISPIAEAAQAIEQEFAASGDWSAQLHRLMALGRSLPGLPAAERTDEHRVHGCQSQLWVAVRQDGRRLHIDADSDAMVMRGALSLIVRLYDDRAAGDVLEHLRDGGGSLAVIERLAPNRSTGLRALIRRIEDVATAAVETGGGGPAA